MNDKWYFSTVDVSQIFSLLQIVTNYFKVLKFEKRSGIFASKNYPVFSTFTRLTKWHKMTQNDAEKKAAQPTVFRQLYGLHLMRHRGLEPRTT